MLSVLAGASLLALAGAAHAGEPVTLTSAQLDDVSAGGLFTHYQNILVINNISSRVSITGNSAVAEANAEATGNNTLTKSLTLALANSGWSGSSSFSSASVD